MMLLAFLVTRSMGLQTQITGRVDSQLFGADGTPKNVSLEMVVRLDGLKGLVQGKHRISG